MIYLGYLEDFSIIVRQYELKMVPVMLPIKKIREVQFSYKLALSFAISINTHTKLAQVLINVSEYQST